MKERLGHIVKACMLRKGVLVFFGASEHPRNIFHVWQRTMIIFSLSLSMTTWEKMNWEDTAMEKRGKTC